MAIIYTYNVALPESSDILLGTEKSATLRNPTKNFRIGDLAKFIIDSVNGTSLTLPLFFDVTDVVTGLTQTTLVDSIMTQDVNPNGTTLTIAGGLSITADLSVTGAFRASDGKSGNQDQILKSTVTGTQWVDFTSSTFTFTQGVPATTWNITHNLNKFPSITVIDTANTVVTGEYTYIDTNNVTLTFSAGFAGKAYLN
jgi:hypothetical protein|tara:strand:- start:5263 stop:5856 length:594 start_codon:yes stop_codon:yes gene_type:complete